MRPTIDLAEHGSPVAIYSGIGSITSEYGDTLECKFEAGQLDNGDVVLVGEIEGFHFEQIRFSGFTAQTGDGASLSYTDRFEVFRWGPATAGESGSLRGNDTTT